MTGGMLGLSIICLLKLPFMDSGGLRLYVENGSVDPAFHPTR